MVDLARNFSAKKRKQLAKKGHALSDGSFPIVNKADLKNAVQAYGRASNKAKAKRHIIKRARALGATNLLPDDWKKSDKSSEGTMSRIECTYEDCTRTFIDEAMMEDHSEIVHTLSDLRRAASQAVREAHGKRSYLMDMGPDWVVFEAEIEDDDRDYSYGLFKTSFTHSDGKVSLGNSMTEVERKTAYVPVTKSDTASATLDRIGITLSDALVVDRAFALGGKTSINGNPSADTPHEFAQEEPMANPKHCTDCGRREGHPIHS